jgi:hypothetical protein
MDWSILILLGAWDLDQSRYCGELKIVNHTVFLFPIARMT